MPNYEIIRTSVDKSNIWNENGSQSLTNENEQIIEVNNFLPIAYLELAVQKAKSVALIKLDNGGATGFLVSNNLLLTNNHVLPDKQSASNANVIFNYEDDIFNQTKSVEIYKCNPDDFFITNKELDYSLVRVDKRIDNNNVSINSAPGHKWGYIPLVSNKELAVNQNISIIQHPAMRKKEVAFRDNLLEKIDGSLNIVRYTTDTEPGSSGSPAFNDKWEIVALHHAGGEQDPSTGKWVNNEGILMSAIINDLISNLSDSQNGREVLFDLGIQGVKEIKIKINRSIGVTTPLGGAVLNGDVVIG